MDRDQIQHALRTGQGLRAALDAARRIGGDEEVLALSFLMAEVHRPPWVDDALARYWARSATEDATTRQFAQQMLITLEEDPAGRAPGLLAETAKEARTDIPTEDTKKALAASWPRVLRVVNRLIQDVEERGHSKRIERCIRDSLAWQVRWSLTPTDAEGLRQTLLRALRVGLCVTDTPPAALFAAPRHAVPLLGEILRASSRWPHRKWLPLTRVAANMVLTAPPTSADQVAVAMRSELLTDDEVLLLVEALLSVPLWARDPSLLMNRTSESVLVALYEGTPEPGQRRLADFVARMRSREESLDIQLGA
ncbi:MAG: hypothetical protein GY913_06945 [Proteobacteria bacterium]|nr:hypothetical protein [Pseudomonadota bacterium]MCP4916644.1 hypothetical protein [Pseudomonadota bacterium]